MNSEFATWYAELYRLFSLTLLTVAQTIKLGACLRSIQAGENPLYHLKELLYSVSENRDLASRLREFIEKFEKSVTTEEGPSNDKNNNKAYKG